MAATITQTHNFHSLSVRDLLDALDAYHVHLAQLDNVVATAVGRYRFRRDDPTATNAAMAQTAHRGPWKESAPRFLKDTIVTPLSWPCILVFVDSWMSKQEWEARPDQVVPRFLYLADGRVIPTCVVRIGEQGEAPPLSNALAFPSRLIGGGYPVLTDVQGQEHLGSIGCLVTDGDTYYALGNRHVAGEAGRPIYSTIRGVRQQIGTSTPHQIGRLPFARAYPGWPDMHAYAKVDAGLIRVADIVTWTTQVFGIGEIGEPVDLNPDTMTLDLIGLPVRAFGCGSGPLLGEIQGLFYRYRSMGGFDYVADLMIGPRSGQEAMHTCPGDSGTLWFIDEPDAPHGRRAPRLRPIALQWGGQRLLQTGDETRVDIALATCLSTICRQLDVEVVRDWNIGHSEYWGKIGHYKLGASACSLVGDPKLATLLQHNLDRIAFDDSAIQSGELTRIDKADFIPLADVADFVWRLTRRKDAANHFADMDEPGTGNFAGTTLLELCKDPANVDVGVWNRFYDSLKRSHGRGALPFRVAQIYEDMVRFIQAGKVPEFLCAAGIVAHYVADACEPLHVSFLHHGRPEQAGEAAVHTVYEETMLEQRAAEMIEGVNEQLQGRHATAGVVGGHGAAVAVVELMRQTMTTLPPMDIIAAFEEAQGRKRISHMWSVLGERAITCMAEGALCLASVWESAWREGGGSTVDDSGLQPIDRDTLMRLYNDPTFLPAIELPQMEQATVLP